MLRRVFVYALTLILALGSLTSFGMASAANAAPALQSTTGRLIGTVINPQNEVIAGANVVVTDNQTGKTVTLTTGAEGTFQIPQLDIGTYTVKVTAQGFKSYTATDLKIDVGKEYSLSVQLEVGAVTESVTVTAGAEVINSTNAELSTTVSARQIKELPLNGRNPLSLIGLQAGTSQNGNTNTTINGQRSSFTNITRDGINIQDNFIRANATDFVPDRPNVDDVSEFTIVTSNAGAELGYGSSQIQLVTPRGSNGFHGAGYIYNRNSAFSANTYFNNALGRDAQGNPKAPLPFLNRNQVGGSFSGPIIKDKVFFFFSFEAFRLRQSTSSLRTVLFPAARLGNFTYLDNTKKPDGTPDPVQRTVNVLALSGLAPSALIQSRILANVPAGNSAEAGDGFNTTGFRFSQLQNQDRDAYTSRFDYEINSKNALNVVYTYKKELLLRPDVDAQQGGAAAGFLTNPFGNQDANTPFLAAAYRMNPSANLTNEIRGGFQKSDPKFDRTNEPSDFFIQIPLISNPESGFEKQGRNTTIGNLQDNAVWARGAHSFRFGGQAQIFRVQPYGPGAFGNPVLQNVVIGTNTNTPTLVAAQFPGGINASQLGNANSLDALLAGIVSSTNKTFAASSRSSGFASILPVHNLHYENYSGYFSDQWRVRPQLTVNLGVRYDLFTSIREPNGLALEAAIQPGTDPVAAVLNPNGLVQFVGGNAEDGSGKRFFKADKNNLAPIVSVAWSPDFKSSWLKSVFPGEGKTVLRGGYRESYVNDEFVRAADNALSGNAGLVSGVNVTQLNARFGSVPSVPVPTFQVPRTFAQNNAIAGLQGAGFAIDPNLRIPRTQEYNFSIQREVGWNMVAEVRYVGGRSHNLVRGKDFNQVDIFQNGFADDFIRARANLILSDAAHAANPAIPVSGAFNPAIAGSQQLTVFPKLGSGGALSNGTVVSNLRAGTAADLAVTYVISSLAGTVKFFPNPNLLAADLLLNDAKYSYNSLQAEIRRRFTNGFYFQANYTFQKTLTDAGGVGQTRFDPPLNLYGPEMEYARATFDQTHVFNFNTIYELPFGKGRKFLSNTNGVVDRIVSGFQATSIIRWATGAPISITDPTGTFNRAARAANQTALTNLNKDQIKQLIGVFKTPCGVFFINPSVIDFNMATCNDPKQAGARSGRGTAGFGNAPFAGQVFFNNGPGQTSGLERFFINGPVFFNWDASIIKSIPIRESLKVQLRVEAFNVINRANFFQGNMNINSTSFGRVTQLATNPRILQLVGRIEF